MTAERVRIRYVHFRNVKTLRDFRIAIDSMNVAVGPNNAGKSTIVGAFRVLAAGLTTARAKSPELLGPSLRRGWRIVESQIPMSMENIHTDYADVDSSVTFRLSNGNELELLFPSSGGSVLYLGRESKQITRPREFQLSYPVTVSVVPELGPLEHEEEIVLEETVRRNLATHRASRNFRNYWWYYPDAFAKFREALGASWPGSDIEPPRQENPLDTKLTMFSREGRFLRELYWAGFGFQVWCQLLTHIGRAGSSTLLLVDEPETYLHPVLQRQVLQLLRQTTPDVFIATHSSEIVAEADPADILLIDPTRRSARRMTDLAGVQETLDHIGSRRNVVMTHLARTSSALLVEGDDFDLVRAFARVLGLAGLATGILIAPFPLNGFPTAERVRSICEGIRTSLGEQVFIAACFDRDHKCDAEIEHLRVEFSKSADKVHILRRHEIESYLLDPAIVQRSLDQVGRRRGQKRAGMRTAEDLLWEATESMHSEVVAARGAERYRYLRSSGVNVLTTNRDAANEVDEVWPGLASRIALAPGKELISALNRLLRPQGIALSVQSLVGALETTDVPPDLALFLKAIESRISSVANKSQRSHEA